MSDLDSFFSGGGPALKFPTMGTTHTLTITEDPEVSQQTDFDTGEPLVWADGKPRQQVIITGTVTKPEGPDDNGERRLFVKSGLVKAMRAAMKEAGVRAPAIGGVLVVKYDSDGPKPARGYAPKQYVMRYTPPTSSAVADALGVDEDEVPAQRQAKPARRSARDLVTTPADDSEEPPF